MKLNTDAIKDFILKNHEDIEPKTLKRTSKKKTNNGILRTFQSNLGDIAILSNEDDTSIIDISLSKENASTSKPVSKENKFEKYLFAVDNNISKEEWISDPEYNNFIQVSIVKKKYWATHKHTDDQEQREINKKLEKLNIYSENDTSDFNAYNYKSKDDVISLLKSLGMTYSNEIAEFYNSLGSDCHIEK